jgi:hypothetical protein
MGVSLKKTSLRHFHQPMIPFNLFKALVESRLQLLNSILVSQEKEATLHTARVTAVSSYPRAIPLLPFVEESH